MRKHPPLWAALSAVALIMLVGVYLQSTTSGRDQVKRKSGFELFALQTEKFLTNYRPNPDQLRVMCWGSSLTRQAIENSDVFNEKLTDLGLDADVRKVYMAAVNTRNFPYLDEFFEAAGKMSPHLICIEDHVFGFANRNWQNSKLAKEFRFRAEELTSFSPRKRRNKIRDDNFETYHQRFEKEQGKDTTRLPPINRSILGFDEHDEIRDKLNFALTNKIPIAIINVPRVGKLEQRLRTPKVETDMEALIASYRSLGFEIEYWECPDYLPFSHYADYAHMNSRGRKVYSDWLAGKIADLLHTRYPQ